MTSVVASPPTRIVRRKTPSTVQRKLDGYFGQIKHPESDGKPMAEDTK
jgi:hypothetical protein